MVHRVLIIAAVIGLFLETLFHQTTANPPLAQDPAQTSPHPQTQILRFKLNASQLRDWVGSDPEAQRLLNLPAGPERDLFESLLKHTYDVLNVESGSTISFSGQDSRSHLYSLTFGIANEIMQSGPSRMSAHPYPEYLGMIMQLQFVAIDSLSAPLPHLTFNRFMAGLQFMIQAMGSGHHSPEAIRKLAEKATIDLVDELNKRKVSQKVSGTQLLRVLESLGLPLSLDGTTLAPHWKYWNVHDYKVLEGPPVMQFNSQGPSIMIKSRQAQSIFDVLIEQTRPQDRPDEAAQMRVSWENQLLTTIDWKAIFPNHFTSITGDQKSEIIRNILDLREPNPVKYSAAVRSMLEKLPYLKGAGISTPRARQLWKEVFEKSLPIVYQLRKQKLGLDQEMRDFKAKEQERLKKEKTEKEQAAKAEAERTLRSEKAKIIHQKILNVLHTNHPDITYLSLHAAFIAELVRDSIIEGRTEAPSDSLLTEAEQSPGSLSVAFREFLVAALAQEQKHNDVLKKHLLALEGLSSSKRGPLEAADRAEIGRLQRLIFVERIAQMESRTPELRLDDNDRNSLIRLGLAQPQFSEQGASAVAAAEIARPSDAFELYRLPSLQVREGESDLKVLKRSASRERGIQNGEDPTAMAAHLFRRMLIDESELVETLEDTTRLPVLDDRNTEFDDAEVHRQTVQYAHWELFRALKILVHKSPATVSDFKAHLADKKLLNGLTKDSDPIILPDWMAARIMNQARSIMHTMTYPTSCRDSILQFIPAPAGTKTN